MREATSSSHGGFPTPASRLPRRGGVAQGLDLLCTRGDNLVAVVTHRPLIVDVPAFGLDAIAPLADFIEACILAARNRA